MLPGLLHVRSGVDYCAPPVASLASRTTDSPTGVVHSGVYVSDIPITLIQEVAESHAIYGGNNVELAREYIVVCRSRCFRDPSIDRADFGND